MEERNRPTLDQALRQLPTYEAPFDLWERIEEDLEQAQRYDDALADLPVYQAPKSVWEAIEQDLAQKKRLRTRWLRPLSAAAAVLLLFTAGWYLLREQDPPEQVQISYRTEIAKSSSTAAFQLPAEDAEFQEVQHEYARFCQLTKQDCRLNQELNELNNARAELIQAMRTFGKDETLYRQIDQIEMDRSKVVKQMVAVML
jgi:hypothetical protein